jgi:hypothetical protein
MPKGSSALSFDIQKGRFTLWALVDPKEEMLQLRRFEIVGTGYDTERRSFEYCGTVNDGPFVWHLFEVSVTDPHGGFDG